MKKLMIILLMMTLFVGSAAAERVGGLTNLNSPSEEDCMTSVQDVYANAQCIFAQEFDEMISYRFYDSLNAMLMALQAGEIDSMDLPDFVAEPLLLSDAQYAIREMDLTPFWTGCCLGFRSEDTELREQVNAVLAEMRAEGRLALLTQRYITGPEAEAGEAPTFERLEGAESLVVAVTGDLPPLDYVAADGQASGFNVAVLAELGRRLHMNIELMNIETGARAIALASERADCVFWFMSSAFGSDTGDDWDIPEGIALSEPYFSWNRWYLVGLK